MVNVPNLIEELKKMSADCKKSPNSEDRTVFLGKAKTRVRVIGAVLNSEGGYDLMYFALLQIPKYDQLELSHAWDGIGDWQV